MVMVLVAVLVLVTIVVMVLEAFPNGSAARQMYSISVDA